MRAFPVHPEALTLLKVRSRTVGVTVSSKIPQSLKSFLKVVLSILCKFCVPQHQRRDSHIMRQGYLAYD